MWNKLNHFALSLIARVQLMKEDGQALVEYSLILALVAVALIGALGLLAGGIEKEFEAVINAL